MISKRMKETKEIKYSVVIPSWCRNLQYFKQCINSVLTQTVLPEEVIVCYDKNYILEKGIMDISPYSKILNSFETPVKIIECFNAWEKWPWKTRNVWFNKVSEWITHVATLDDDDIWRPHKAETQIKYLKDNPGTWIIGSDYLEVDKDGVVIRYAHRPKIRDLILHTYRMPFKTSTIMIDKMLLGLSWWFSDKYPEGEDEEFFFRILKEFPSWNYANIKDYLLTYRFYDQSFSSEKRRSYKIQSLKILFEHQFPKSFKEIVPFTKEVINRVRMLRTTRSDIMKKKREDVKVNVA